MAKRMAQTYLDRISAVITAIKSTQSAAILSAARVMADSIAGGGLVHLFGSGHSVIPVMDCFPRYGSFVGFHPFLDPRLMWFNVIGAGGARELLWLERREGYVDVLLKNLKLRAGDTVVVFSHGGLNAAPLEMAMRTHDRGLSVVAITSMANQRLAEPSHSSGKKLSEVADIVIDNCVPPEDALVCLEGVPEPVGAGSTVATVVIMMTLLTEVARIFAEQGHRLDVFVSPNVPGVSKDHNEKVFEAYEASLEAHSARRGTGK